MGRSTKKGPYIAYHLLKRVQTFRKREKREAIKTWSRASTILPIMIGQTISVYNGKKHVPLYISDTLVGHKLGEFAATRLFQSHKKKVERKVNKKSI